ncbi:hypothetical protein ACFOLL_09630 [Falsochrobactrum ovis]|uniref:hypothetical protein n=1 Tax=Falsochrobactrum ovis TaxID=1293442 RepID=UPI00361A9DC1
MTKNLKEIVTFPPTDQRNTAPPSYALTSALFDVEYSLFSAGRSLNAIRRLTDTLRQWRPREQHSTASVSIDNLQLLIGFNMAGRLVSLIRKPQYFCHFIEETAICIKKSV